MLITYNPTQLILQAFLLEPMIEISYGPHDLALIDGNITHGVTNIVHGERFSNIIFNTWKRDGRMKVPGVYTGMNTVKMS